MEQNEGFPMRKVYNIKCLHLKMERSHINNLMLLKGLGKPEQMVPKTSKWEEIIKVRTKINKMEQKIKKSIKGRLVEFLEKINKIEKSLAKLIKRERRFK